MRREFSKQVKRDAFLRAGGCCENPQCGAKLTIGKFHYDHDTPDALGGSNLLDNCRVLCVGCHRNKTAQVDIRRIAKTKRINDKHLGIRKPRTIRAWRKFNGEIVHAERER